MYTEIEFSEVWYFFPGPQSLDHLVMIRNQVVFEQVKSNCAGLKALQDLLYTVGPIVSVITSDYLF